MYILIFPFLCVAAYQDNFMITVYPSKLWITDPVIIWESRTWSEAFTICPALGLKFYYGSSENYLHDYIIGQALHQNRSEVEGFWIGAIRPEGSTSWLRDDCRPTNDDSNVAVDTSDALCLILNISAPIEANVYGIPCNLQFSFACMKSHGYYTANPDRYAVLSRAKTTKNSPLTVFFKTSNISLDVCIFTMFKNPSPLAEFTVELHETLCTIYTYPANQLPVAVEMQNVTEDITTIYTSYVDVSYREKVDINISSAELPCQIETTTSVFTTGEIEISTTSMESISSTVSSTYPTLTSQCCTCARRTNTSSSDIDKLIEEIQQDLKIETRTLSSFKRKKSSATDNRPLSKGMGYVAVIVLVLVGSVIVTFDILHFFVQPVK